MTEPVFSLFDFEFLFSESTCMIGDIH